MLNEDDSVCMILFESTRGQCTCHVNEHNRIMDIVLYDFSGVNSFGCRILWNRAT